MDWIVFFALAWGRARVSCALKDENNAPSNSFANHYGERWLDPTARYRRRMSDLLPFCFCA
ncbi:hypothetical protein OSA72_02250 [Treponema pallidum]|nr:hypothetical protein OSA72_02250 [Treponema pallidum]